MAVGGRERYNDVLLENAFGLEWGAFCGRYHEAVTSALQLRLPFDPVGSAVWNIAIFIGNLPTLQFTSFSVHTQTVSTGRPVFYFGKRYRAGDGLSIPLYVQFDHANTDPYVLNLFLEDYQRLLAETYSNSQGTNSHIERQMLRETIGHVRCNPCNL